MLQKLLARAERIIYNVFIDKSVKNERLIKL